MSDMRSPLAKARDKWLESDEGKKCLSASASGQYLQNRLECAFIAGHNEAATALTQLQAELSGKERDAKRYRGIVAMKPTTLANLKLMQRGLGDDAFHEGVDKALSQGGEGGAG